MKKIYIVLFLIPLYVGNLCAASEEGFQWSRATLDAIESGDAKRGKKVAAEHKCKKCHGKTGISDEDDTPSIAGQVPAYHFKQLMDYKYETREEKTMTKRARKLSAQDMADLAAWFGSQESEQRGGTKIRLAIPKLVTHGDPKRFLLPCNVCHGKEGEGMGVQVPAISGQKQEAFVDTMTYFRDGDRENDEYGRMRFIAQQLTEEEIEQLAKYYGAKLSDD